MKWNYSDSMIAIIVKFYKKIATTNFQVISVESLEQSPFIVQ